MRPPEHARAVSCALCHRAAAGIRAIRIPSAGVPRGTWPTPVLGSRGRCVGLGSMRRTTPSDLNHRHCTKYPELETTLGCPCGVDGARQEHASSTSGLFVTDCPKYATVSGIKQRIGSFYVARRFVDWPIREPGLRAQLQRPYVRVTGARVAKPPAPSQVSRTWLAGRATDDASGAYRRSPGGCFESGWAAAEGRGVPPRRDVPILYSFRCASPPVREQSTHHAHAGFRVRSEGNPRST